MFDGAEKRIDNKNWDSSTTFCVASNKKELIADRTVVHNPIAARLFQLAASDGFNVMAPKDISSEPLEVPAVLIIEPSKFPQLQNKLWEKKKTALAWK